MLPRAVDNRYAVIDIGSNTFHLLIVDIDANNSSYQQVFRERVFVYLYEDGRENLGNRKLELAIQTLDYFKNKCNQYGATNTKAVATAAFRNFKNKDEVLKKISAECRLPIEIISGLREAELICKGNQWCLSIPDKTLILDIGGGSIELIPILDGAIHNSFSFQCGISLLRSLFPVDAFRQKERVALMTSYIQETVLTKMNITKSFGISHLLGASGPFEILEQLEDLQ